MGRNVIIPKRENEYLSLLYGESPYENFDYKKYALDTHGWTSTHPIFEELIAEISPKIIIEVGTWKGASAIHMAKIVKEKNLDCVIFCVDTWLGAIEHLLNPRLGLTQANGYPNLYYQFLANVMHEGLEDIIVPIPNTSLIAAKWLKGQGIKADLIYIDASHDEDDVYADICAYWKLLDEKGAIFGDDWDQEWHGTICAVNRFWREKDLFLSVNGNKWRLMHKT